MKKALLTILAVVLMLPMMTYADLPDFDFSIYGADDPWIFVNPDLQSERRLLVLYKRDLSQGEGDDLTSALYLADTRYHVLRKLQMYLEQQGVALTPPDGQVTAEWERDMNLQIIYRYWESGLGNMVNQFQRIINLKSNRWIKPELTPSVPMSQATLDYIQAGALDPGIGTEGWSSPMGGGWSDLEPNPGGPTPWIAVVCGQCDSNDKNLPEHEKFCGKGLCVKDCSSKFKGPCTY